MDFSFLLVDLEHNLSYQKCCYSAAEHSKERGVEMKINSGKSESSLGPKVILQHKASKQEPAPSKSPDTSVIENQTRKDDEPLSKEKMAELLHDESSVSVSAAPSAHENKLIMQKQPEEDKRIADKEFILNSKRSHKGNESDKPTPNPTPPPAQPAKNATPPAVEIHEEGPSKSTFLLQPEVEHDPSMVSSQRGKDPSTLTLGKKSSASECAKTKITEEIIAKGKKLTLQVVF